ncbi:MAG: hypothetical protein JWN78_2780 [Bacteroidota bacterium]|nr:hypothetical protein [Bacteroidota bacterium]
MDLKINLIYCINIFQGNMSEDNDKYYKWYIFYYNPEDPRLFVPKRIAWTGWSLNFANPYAYLVLAISLFILGLTSYFLR